MIRKIKLLLLGGCFLLFLVSGLNAAENPKAAVFLSDVIKPYFEAVQGIEKLFKENNIEMKLVEINTLEPGEFDGVSQNLISQGYSYWISVGPQAMKMMHLPLQQTVSGKVYCMVLFPEKTVEKPEEDLCGVSLQIPVEQQVSKMVNAFPLKIRPGIIYDPRYNREFAGRASAEFSRLGVPLALLEVNSRADVPTVLFKDTTGVNLLWMIPDQTVITESIIRYIVKNSIKKGIGVVGYNRFFVTQGAVAAFVIDYESVGRQAAQITLDMMTGRVCRSQVPVFELMKNEDIVKLLDWGTKN